MRKVRIIANANSKAVPTVHVFAGVTGPTGEIEQCTQIGPTGVTGEFKTYQGVTGAVGPTGMKSIIIAGYTGPL